jgi:hypothetical protein
LPESIVDGSLYLARQDEQEVRAHLTQREFRTGGSLAQTRDMDFDYRAVSYALGYIVCNLSSGTRLEFDIATAPKSRVHLLSTHNYEMGVTEVPLLLKSGGMLRRSTPF